MTTSTRITGLFSIDNGKHQVTKASWECQLCRDVLKIDIDTSKYLQFEDRICPRCNSKFEVGSYRVYSN